MNSRWTKTFPAAATFSCDLGSLGTWVGPRTGAAKRNQSQREEYVLRRLLVAWRRNGVLNYPFTLCASNQAPQQPDFVLTDPKNGRLGIEITEAGSEDWQAQLTQQEKQRNDGLGSHLMPLGSKQESTRDIQSAIRKKVLKAGGSAYQGTVCDLAIYDNTRPFHGLTIDDIRDLNSPDIPGRFKQVHLISGPFVYTDVLGNRPGCINVSTDYDIDFAEWISDQVESLRNGQVNRLDVESIIEELTALANRDRRALRSHLRVLLLHLLKWRHQPHQQSRNWRASIDNARTEIEELLASSPSLRRDLVGDATNEASALAWAYGKARQGAQRDTGLDLDAFPKDCPFPLDHILDENYLPN